MRYFEIAEQNDDAIPHPKAADLLMRIDGIEPDNTTDDAARNLTKQREIRKPKLVDTI